MFIRTLHVFLPGLSGKIHNELLKGLCNGIPPMISERLLDKLSKSRNFPLRYYFRHRNMTVYVAIVKII